MKSIPDSGLAPAAKPPPAGDAGSETKLGWQVLPADAGVQHEEDALQAFPIVQRDWAMPCWPVSRKELFDPSPQLVLDFPWSQHDQPTSGRQVTGRTPGPVFSEELVDR